VQCWDERSAEADPGMVGLVIVVVVLEKVLRRSVHMDLAL
jgi:hypothetical protein